MSVFLWSLCSYHQHGGMSVHWLYSFSSLSVKLLPLTFNSALFRTTAARDWIGKLLVGHYVDKIYTCNWPLEGSEPIGQTHTDIAICKAAKASAQQHYRAWPDVIWQTLGPIPDIYVKFDFSCFWHRELGTLQTSNPWCWLIVNSVQRSFGFDKNIFTCSTVTEARLG